MRIIFVLNICVILGYATRQREEKIKVADNCNSNIQKFGEGFINSMFYQMGFPGLGPCIINTLSTEIEGFVSKSQDKGFMEIILGMWGMKSSLEKELGKCKDWDEALAEFMQIIGRFRTLKELLYHIQQDLLFDAVPILTSIINLVHTLQAAQYLDIGKYTAELTFDLLLDH